MGPVSSASSVLSVLANLDEAGRLPLLLLFLCFHLIFGAALPIRAGGKPFLWALFGNAGGEIARRLNKSSRTINTLRSRGRVVIVMMTVLAALIGFAAGRLALYPFGWTVQFILLSCGITALFPGKILRKLEQIDKASGQNDKVFAKSAAALLQPYHLEDLSQADAYALRRKAIIWSARAFVRYLAVPAFFYLLLGITGFCIGVALLSLSDAYLNLRVEYAEIGGPMRRLDKMIVWIPSALASLMLVLSSLFVPRGNPLRALNILRRQYKKYHPTQDGLVVAAAAGALNVTLGGSVRYPDGHTAQQGWIGPKNSTAQVTNFDVHRARLLFFVSFLWFIIMLSVFLSVLYIFS